LPTEAPQIGAERALELIRMDKKVLMGAVRLVLLEKLGRGVVMSKYREDALQATLIEYFS
jgi:3-dehydroquinate synthetase